MGLISEKLRTMGVVLPAPIRLPDGELPFPWVRVLGNRALISGHGPASGDGLYSKSKGRVGAEVSFEEAYAAARDTAYAVLANLERELGDLDRVAGWARVFGMVNCAPGFARIPEVINGFSDVIIEVYGLERGRHARSAIGVAELPFGIPVEVEAEVLLA
jgi:enamine deaminase RidA (YjgF/YER057c/UK114 family)